MSKLKENIVISAMAHQKVEREIKDIMDMFIGINVDNFLDNLSKDNDPGAKEILKVHREIEKLINDNNLNFKGVLVQMVILALSKNIEEIKAALSEDKEFYDKVMKIGNTVEKIVGEFKKDELLKDDYESCEDCGLCNKSEEQAPKMNVIKLNKGAGNA